MLPIEIPPAELWDEKKQEFVNFKGQSLVLEHSLISVSRWEAKFNKPFFTKDKKTKYELDEYIKCMTITQNVPNEAYHYLTSKNYKDIQDYIESSMTATTFREDKNHPHSNEFVTSELVYYWMTALQIPFECEKWHINRLFTLIRICNEKNKPAKKPTKAEMRSQQSAMSALNAERRKQLNTSG